MSGKTRALGGMILGISLFGLGSVGKANVNLSVACGDVNGDETIDISDGIELLRWLYLTGPEPACGPLVSDCGDVNADERVDISDAVYIFGWLFLGYAAPQCSVVPTFTPIGDNAQGYPEYVHDQTGIVFVRLPGGTFDMGAQDQDSDGANYDPAADYSEAPVHEVTLSPFLIGKYEVTQAQWEQVMGLNPSFFDGEFDRRGNPIVPPYDRGTLPVEQVHWPDMQDFEAATGLMLPTEAQWEYACRAGTTGQYAGTGRMDDMGWYDENSGGITHPVGEKAPNQFGLHDMHGNIWEQCEDWYQNNFYGESDGATDPLCADSTSSLSRVFRGGCFFASARRCRSADRLGDMPSSHASGFRLASPSP